MALLLGQSPWLRGDYIESEGLRFAVVTDEAARIFRRQSFDHLDHPCDALGRLDETLQPHPIDHLGNLLDFNRAGRQQRDRNALAFRVGGDPHHHHVERGLARAVPVDSAFSAGFAFKGAGQRTDGNDLLLAAGLHIVHESLADLERAQGVGAEEMDRHVIVQRPQRLGPRLGEIARYAGVVDEHVDRHAVQLLRQRVDARVVGHVQLFRAHLGVLLLERRQGIGRRVAAVGGDHGPSPVRVLLGEFQPDPSIGPGNEHGLRLRGGHQYKGDQKTGEVGSIAHGLFPHNMTIRILSRRQKIAA